MLPYDNRLVKKKDFEKTYKSGKRSFAGNIGLNFLKNGSDKTRLGVAVGIKFSKKAVVRNMAKRKIKEILRKNLEKIEKGYDVIISIKADKAGRDKLESYKIENNIKEAFQRARLLKN